MSDTSKTDSGVSTPTTSAPTTTNTNVNGNRQQGYNRHRGGNQNKRFGTNRNSDREHVNDKRGYDKTSSNFKGNTAEMNGHVFQVHSESNSEKQFAKTYEMLGQYAKKHLTRSGDLDPLLNDMGDIKTPTLKEPEDIDPNASTVKKKIWDEQVKKYVERLEKLEDNLKAIYAVIWGQCSENMQNKIKSIDDFEEKNKSCDCVWLLQSIRKVTYNFEDRRYVYASLLNAELNYLNYKQHEHETVAQYLMNFRTRYEVFEHYGGCIGTHDTALKAVPDDSGKLTDNERRAKSRDATLAHLFIRHADPKRFATLIVDLDNQYSRGNNQFPVTLQNAYTLLSEYKVVESAVLKKTINHTPQSTPVPQMQATQDDVGNAMTFTQSTKIVAGTDGTSKPDIRCYKCNNNGHYAPQCPSGSSDVQLFQSTEMVTQPNVSFTFHQQHLPNGASVPDTWILLDSQSTVSVFKNPNYLTNIRPSTTVLTVYTNGGIQRSSLVGDIANFGMVWYNPDSLANILSLAAVRKQCKVTMDSSVEPCFLVHRNNGNIMKFLEYANGLYFHDPEAPTSDFTFVSTVQQNKQLFTNREVTNADAALALHQKLGRPSQQVFENILKTGQIRNCPITVDDAKRAFIIYGPCTANLKGAATRSNSEHVPSLVPSPLPSYITEYHNQVTLCIDIFYVQRIIFFTTISRKIKFRTISVLQDRNKSSILKELNIVIKFYQSRGFTIPDIHCDQEFECLRNDILPIQLNVVPADAHVGDVERSIRTIKERVRSTIHGLPFRRYPKLMIRELVFSATKWLNQFPADGGISDTLSPFTIMTGRPNVDFNTLKLEFGSYVQVFEDNFPTNSMKSRNTGAITLSHTGNSQGDYYFMSLETGRRLCRHAWTLVPMPNAVISLVEQMALAEQQPLIEGGLPLFELTPGLPVQDDPEFDDIADDILHGPDIDPVPVFEPLIPVPPQPAPEIIPDPQPDLAAPDVPPIVANPLQPDHHNDAFDAVPDNPPPPEFPDDLPDLVNDIDDIDDFQPPAPPPADLDQGDHVPFDHPEPPYNLRPHRELSYEHRFDHQFFQAALDAPTLDIHSLQQCTSAFLFHQMTASAGIKKHGQPALDALLAEFCQLESKHVFTGIDPSTLSLPQKRSALRLITLLKEKRDGRLKGRTCADGRPQRSLYTKEDTTSPTLSIDGLFLSLIIDAKEGRHVGIADVQGAYLNAKMDDVVLIRVTGNTLKILCEANPTYRTLICIENGHEEGAYLNAKMDDVVLIRVTGNTLKILCEANPTYRTLICIENGEEVLYLQLLKALYGCVKSALLWYELFVSVLTDLGFELNPYDPCVANTIIDGSQCTIAWYVDDMKISHQDPNVVSNIICSIEKKFGTMTVHRGDDVTFLGMDILFNTNNTVTISMSKFIDEVLEESGVVFHDTSCNTPAKSNLFDIDAGSATLSTSMSDLFHRLVAKLLYLSKRGRPDIQLAVAFLTTRVSHASEQDWTKLTRVLSYLRATRHLTLTLGADSLTKISSWTDASYAVHPDMRSHTGGAISMGTGAIMCKSIKQKLNTKSSTEAEVVGASDFIPSTIWARMFLEAQGYSIDENIFFQDNKSAILLERNGRASSSQRTRHIDIRYFFFTDRINTENLLIQHCPTAAMLADFFTKPLQGSLFTKFRDVILGYRHVSTLNEASPHHSTSFAVPSSSSASTAPTVSSSEERVVNPKKDDAPNESWMLVTRKKAPKKKAPT
jgi:Reverse transcriptase (RNA-dependent DNA polymerase)